MRLWNVDLSLGSCNQIAQHGDVVDRCVDLLRRRGRSGEPTVREDVQALDECVGKMTQLSRWGRVSPEHVTGPTP
ncbi:hypothetical protein [Patulibacter sp.]|uniref:hypothetical protein n=1 Tax=Patulibacter sp. TaxID=1912859 RepID=UPI00272841D1|nr:hypothetical protein [Patulibacter sp.]MDO9406937.1 hypothetical protein [Patulibacter sp.]